MAELCHPVRAGGSRNPLADLCLPGKVVGSNRGRAEECNFPDRAESRKWERRSRGRTAPIRTVFGSPQDRAAAYSRDKAPDLRRRNREVGSRARVEDPSLPKADGSREQVEDPGLLIRADGSSRARTEAPCLPDRATGRDRVEGPRLPIKVDGKGRRYRKNPLRQRIFWSLPRAMMRWQGVTALRGFGKWRPSAEGERRRCETAAMYMEPMRARQKRICQPSGSGRRPFAVPWKHCPRPVPSLPGS